MKENFASLDAILEGAGFRSTPDNGSILFVPETQYDTQPEPIEGGTFKPDIIAKREWVLTINGTDPAIATEVLEAVNAVFDRHGITPTRSVSITR